MGIAKLYSQSGSGGKINGIIEDYYAYAGENISAGDFVEFVNGFSGNTTTTTSNSTVIDTVKNSGDVISAVPLDDNRVFIAYRHYATGDACLCGIVCTIENEKILVGTVTILHASDTINCVSALCIMENKVFVAYDAGSNDYLYGVVCNINGTVITHGTNTRISTTSYSGRNGISTILLDSGNIFIVYDTILGIVCTINNTTISFGTETAISSQNTSRISAVGIGNNRAFVAHSASSSVMGAVCAITNTTIVVNVDTLLFSGTKSGDRINTLQLEENKVFILHSYDSSYFLYGMVCKVVDNTITTGTDTAISLINSSAYVEPSACLLEDGIFVGFGGGSAIHGVVCSINELEMVAGAVKTLRSDVASILSTTSVTLPYNNVFIAHTYGSNYHLYAQIFGTSNKTPSNNVTVPEYETQVRKATTSDIYGVAKTKGVGGDSTGHKDIVSIYTIDTSVRLASLPVGTLVKDPSSTFLGEPVIWKIADVNHEGYPSNSVTLISDKILAMRAFDTMEPNNSDSDRATAGNNRYSVSNIRQWLNSDAEAGQWYSAQHSADTPPSSSYAWNYGTNAYDTKAGFLNSFSQNFKNALLETSLTVALNTVTDGGGSENVIDKIFLASNTETGVSNENNIAEGSLLAVFSDNTSRKAYCTTEAINDSNYSGDPANDTTAWSWWLRTPSVGYSKYTRYITNAGAVAYDDSHASIRGVRPLCNIPSSIKVIQDEDGVYKLDL